ncbi:sodium- and chloride-dependent taurine transporter-like [Mytilus edulis]|uniref:sodium- and chloride-dependent taurine transporter-like n=1 Tax=Mytilus edulis TaxID=6550 RepID=UPI0039EDF71E
MGEGGHVKEKGGIKKRETWSRRFDFLLACIGFSVGLGNVWRFPYLCYKNGGGAFMIPYFICCIVGGIPLFYLEVCVGQFMGVAGLNAWKICPIFQGIGIASTIIMFFSNTFFNVIMAWAFYYWFSSFTSELPWASCGHEWNKNCKDYTKEDGNFTNSSMHNDEMGNITIPFLSALKNTSNQLFSDPVTEFWENKVLGISDGIDQPGAIKWDICLCLLFAWIAVYLCICKGIKSSGKVMYFTATTPYLFMFILLIRNSMLPGAIDGVIYYLKPNLSKLSDMQVWVDAGSQIFFTYSIGVGSLTVLGSFNKFKHNSYKDCIIFACTNTGTSLLAGLIIFTILGHMAFVQDTSIDKVAESGPGLAFIAYPKAVSMMPGAPFWSVLFFFMVILLGFDSQFVGVEAVVTAIVDQWPSVLRRKYRKEAFTAFICFLNFLLGLCMVTHGGIYVFELFNFYSTCIIILLIGFFECVAVAWVYGVRRFYDNVEMMLGRRINPYMGFCWTFLSPMFCLGMFLMSIINYSNLEYKRPSGVYEYPGWAIAIGWSMASFSVMFIPLMIPFNIWRYKLNFQTLHLLLKPQGLQAHQLRPKDKGEKSIGNCNAKSKCCDNSCEDPLDNHYEEDILETKLALLENGTNAHSGINGTNGLKV